jgi:hypothetical protein
VIPAVRLRYTIELRMKGPLRDMALRDLAALEEALLEAHAEIERRDSHARYQARVIRELGKKVDQ